MFFSFVSTESVQFSRKLSATKDLDSHCPGKKKTALGQKSTQIRQYLPDHVDRLPARPPCKSIAHDWFPANFCLAHKLIKSANLSSVWVKRSESVSPNTELIFYMYIQWYGLYHIHYCIRGRALLLRDYVTKTYHNLKTIAGRVGIVTWRTSEITQSWESPWRQLPVYFAFRMKYRKQAWKLKFK